MKKVSRNSQLPSFLVLSSTSLRIPLIASLIVLGFFLITTHKFLVFTLLGMAFWGVALYGCLPFLPPTKGTAIFSQSSLREWKVSREWAWYWSLLVGLGVLLLLRYADQSLQRAAWLPLVLSLLLLSGLLAFLEKKSLAFQEGVETPAFDPSGLSWREGLVLLSGCFFFFYRLEEWPNRAGGECLNTLLAGVDFINGNATTPYVDTYHGLRYFPSMLLGLVMKIIGVSILKGEMIFAAINLVGLLFFHRFLRFYLGRNAALATALLFSASHWNLFMARQTFEGASVIVPFEAAALYFFARAIEKGKARDFTLFGALLACVMSTYLSSRFVVVFFIAAMGVLWLLRPKEMGRGRFSWMWAWGVAALWYLPMVIYFFQVDNHYLSTGFSQRIAEVNVINLCQQEGNWGRLWENIRQGLQMFTVRTTDTWTSWFPFLSPWEGLGLLSGFAWCLWRIYQPAFLLALLGFFGGMCGSVLSDIPTHANRALAGAPFVYLLVGIGLDRLVRTLSAPLGKSSRFLQGFSYAAILVLSMGWQYDIYFHQLPKSWIAWVQGGGPNFLTGKTLASYPGDWDLYVTTSMEFNFEVFSPSKRSLTDWNVFYPAIDFPFKKVPAQGLALLVPQEVGECLEGWMNYYYPGSPPRPIQNPFGGTQFLAWDLTPVQVQKALSIKAPPPGGLTMEWYDSKDRPLGQWRIPTLGPGIQAWFDHPPGSGDFSPDPTVYFTVQGWIQALPGQSFRLETTGDTAWTLGSQAARMTGPLESKAKILRTGSKGWIPFRIRYQWLSHDYTLNLERMGKEGWATIPSEDLKP